MAVREFYEQRADVSQQVMGLKDLLGMHKVTRVRDLRKAILTVNYKACVCSILRSYNCCALELSWSGAAWPRDGPLVVFCETLLRCGSK